MMGMFYADCCQTFMNWFPEIGVTCSTSDGAFGNACAITYTTMYRFWAKLRLLYVKQWELAEAPGGGGRLFC